MPPLEKPITSVVLFRETLAEPLFWILSWVYLRVVGLLDLTPDTSESPP